MTLLSRSFLPYNIICFTFLLPAEDPIPHLLASPPPPPEAAPPVEPSAEVDTPKSASIPDIFGNMGAPEGAVPPHQMMARAASNITAMPARVLGLGRQTDTASKREGKKDVIVDPLDSPVQGGSPVAVLDSPRDAPELSSDGSCGTDSDTSQKRGRRPFRAAWSAASVPMRMAFGAAQMAATVPMRAAPRYHPLGKQLYVTDCITTERPVGKQMSMRSLQPAPAESMPPALEATTAWDAWVPWLRGIRRNQLSAAISVTASGSLDGGDDDNVDVAAAAAAAGALVPERLPARTIFPMHRMVTYRTRLLAICQDALSGHQWPALAPMLPYLGSIPCPGDVLVTELLAPAMFPLKAEASVANIHHPFKLMAPSSGAEAASDPSISGDESAASGEGTALKAPPTRRRVSWLRRLLFKPALSEDDSPVELVVRVEGKGLSNATAAWVSGATVDSSGKALPAAMEIVSRPAAPAPSAVKSAALPPSPVAGPLFVFLSWVTQAAGWVALLRQLQPAGQSDYLLAKVKLPRGAVQEAALAGVDPLLAAAVGEVAPRLMVHIQSDFAVQSIPLEVGHLKRKGGKVMAGGGVRGGFKDPSVFLRHARVALRRRPQSSSV